MSGSASAGKRAQIDVRKLISSGDYHIEVLEGSFGSSTTSAKGCLDFMVRGWRAPAGSLYEGGSYDLAIHLPSGEVAFARHKKRGDCDSLTRLEGAAGCEAACSCSDADFDYPFRSPSVGFRTRLFHPNVDERSGSVCLDVINQCWSPMYDLSNILTAFLPQLLLYGNPADPLNPEAAALQLRDPEAYRARVKEHTAKYASPPPTGAGPWAGAAGGAGTASASGSSSRSGSAEAAASASKQSQAAQQGGPMAAAAAALSVSAAAVSSSSDAGASAAQAASKPAPASTELKGPGLGPQAAHAAQEGTGSASGSGQPGIRVGSGVSAVTASGSACASGSGCSPGACAASGCAGGAGCGEAAADDDDCEDGDCGSDVSDLSDL